MSNSNQAVIPKHKEFFRPADVTAVYGISRTTIFRWIREGKLPKPTHITERVVGWDRTVLEAIFLKK